jgi:hypothetical protein
MGLQYDEWYTRRCPLYRRCPGHSWKGNVHRYRPVFSTFPLMFRLAILIYVFIEIGRGEGEMGGGGDGGYVDTRSCL